MKKFKTLGYKAELVRQKFWYWVLKKHPEVHKFFEKNTKLDTLPF